MRLKSIWFDDNQRPATVTVEMTVREAAWLARFNGRLSAAAVDEILPGFREESSAIYSALVGGLFNRFWDDGVNEALREI